MSGYVTFYIVIYVLILLLILYRIVVFIKYKINPSYIAILSPLKTSRIILVLVFVLAEFLTILWAQQAYDKAIEYMVMYDFSFEDALLSTTFFSQIFNVLMLVFGLTCSFGREYISDNYFVFNLRRISWNKVDAVEIDQNTLIVTRKNALIERQKFRKVKNINEIRELLECVTLNNLT